MKKRNKNVLRAPHPTISTITQAQMNYKELRWFIENKPEVSNELFDVLDKIERFTPNAAINSKTQTEINTFFKYFCYLIFAYTYPHTIIYNK